MAVQLLEHGTRYGGRSEPHGLLVRLRHVDLVLLGSAMLLALIGVVMVYSATRVGFGKYYLKRQLLYVALGVVVMTVVAAVPYRRYRDWAFVIYSCSIVGLLAVFAIGHSALGSQRWISAGPIQIQPSELSVLGVIIVVARIASPRGGVLGMRRIVAMLALAALAMLLVAKQPDLSTAIVIAVVLGAMLVAGGVRMRYLVALVVIAGLGGLLAYKVGLLHHYQTSRFSFLHSGTGSQTTNYQSGQSEDAIGAGGITGVGIFKGSATNLQYVPEQYTDFIFTAVGEQLGFAGSVFVVGLFSLLALRMLRAAQTARDPFGRLVCIGALAFVGFSVFQNIGMTIGLTPIAGIPLPFLSYGGSALFAFFATVGLVLNVEMRRFAR